MYTSPNVIGVIKSRNTGGEEAQKQ